MASLVLGAVGGLIGGPIGFAIGSMIGSLLFPPHQEGPRLTDLKLANSSYGQPIPLIYASMRVAPNVIWQTDLREHEHGGKGGPDVTTFSYSASFAMQLCANEIEGINRIWWNGTLIWNIDGSVGESMPCVLYLGTETQLPDPTMEAVLGVGNVPAYRGTAYVVFTDYDLIQGGNAIGNWTFEVVQNSPPGELTIVEENDSTGHTFTGFAAIQQWDSPTDIPVVSGTSVSTTYSLTVSDAQDYDPTTLANTGAHVGALIYPQWWSGIAATHYFGIGNYVYSDGTTISLHFGVDLSSVAISSSDENPHIISSATVTSVFDPVHSVFNAFDSARFLYTAGVPAGLFCSNTCMTEDGKALFAFTRVSAVASVDHWYKIVDGVVAADGTVDPSIASYFTSNSGPYGQTGKPHGVPGDGTIMNSMSVENNGTYFWYMQGAAQTVRMFVIDGSGNLNDWGNGSLSIPFSGASPNGGIEGSIRSLATTGFAGVAKGHNLFLLSRVAAVSTGIPLSEIVADLSERAGLTSAQIDVTALTDIVDGYTIAQQMSSRDAITPLQSAFYFDAVESSGVMKYVKRGGASVLTIPDNDLAAQVPGSQPPPLLTIDRAQEVDLPAIVNVKYVNAANDYQIGTQMSQRQVTNSQLNSTIELSINMNDLKAKQVANTLLFNGWWERQSAVGLTSRKYSYLEPTDVITWRSQQMRIANKSDIASNIEQFDCVAAVTALWTQGPSAVASSGFTPSTPPSTQPTQLALMDIPLVIDTDHPNGLYAGMAGATSDSWRGANLYKSVDGGTTYNQIASTGTAAIMGTTPDVLGDFTGGNVFDEINTASVVIGPGGGELASANELAVLNGANAFLWGNEILQAKNCVLTAPSTYLLSGFLRGRRGTEFAIPLHSAGEQVIALPTVDVDAPFNELAQVRQYKAVSFNTSLASAAPVSFVNYGAKLRPYSPADLGGGVDASGNVTINWTRRTRIGGAWADFTDVSLSEPNESYVLQIWSANFHQVARIVTGLTSPTFVYTSAMQVTDFGSQQQTIFVSVGQVGIYTLGTQATAQIPGAGGSNSAPSNPQTPYNNPPPQTGTGCSGTVVSDTLDWATPTYIFSPDGFGGANQTWVMSFTTGSITAGVGRVVAFAGSGDQLVMGGTLTNEPCGFPLPPTQTRLPISSLVQFSFYMTGNPNPGALPTLLPSTTYYFCVTRPSTGAAMSAILYSPGN